MAAGILRNAAKRHYSGYHLFRKPSIANSIKPPLLLKPQFKTNSFTRFPNSVYKKARELNLVIPNSLISSSFSSTALTFSKNGFVVWYLGLIKTRPILTKAITSALIYAVSDLSSQKIARQSSEPYDLIRTLRVAGIGFLIVGPSMHFWFNSVSKVLPKLDVFTTIAKIVLGQILYGPTVTAVFFSVNAGLQGENHEEIFARLKRDLVPALISGVMYWPLCDYITYKFIPVQLQPLVSNSFSYVWTVYITYMASLEKVEVEVKALTWAKSENS